MPPVDNTDYTLFLNAFMKRIGFSGIVHGRKRPNIFILEELETLDRLVSDSHPDILCAESVTYAQYSEDIIIDSILKAKRPSRYRNKKITYCDIGANHPINMSNTYLLYCAGFRGLLVEPNPLLANLLKTSRPGDELCPVAAVGDQRKEALLYLPQFHETTSLRKDFILAYRSKQNLEQTKLEEIVVKALNINDIFDTYFANDEIDFLNIDLEGMDIEVLSAIDFSKHRPFLICIEPSSEIKGVGLSRADEAILDILSKNCYQLTARTPANMIFVWEDKC
jgi:FkbM family methyltransferase